MIEHISLRTTTQRRIIWRTKPWLWSAWRLNFNGDNDRAAVEMPPPSTSRVSDGPALSLASQCPLLRGGRLYVGGGL